MKKLIVFLFVLTAFASCKKKDPEPKDPAKEVAGTYQLSSSTFGPESDLLDLPRLPLKQNGVTISGTIDVTATATDLIDMRVTLKATGQQPESFDLEGLEVKPKSGGYGLYVDGDLVADATGKEIIFNYSEYDSQTKETTVLKFTAEK